ncbi:hypothetical protein Tco_0375487, partial [Tanacetum coccineum]
ELSLNGFARDTAKAHAKTSMIVGEGLRQLAWHPRSSEAVKPSGTVEKGGEYCGEDDVNNTKKVVRRWCDGRAVETIRRDESKK